MRTLIAVALAGAALGAGGMWALDQGRAGGSVGPQVRAYLLAHPEVVEQAIQGMQDMQTGRLVARNRDAIVRPYAGAWAGNPKGDVSVVEYFDYNCGYCRAALPTIDALIRSDPGVRIVYREWPILAQGSVDAAKVSLAAAAQGRYARFHAALYAGGPVTPVTLVAAARTAGVDAARVPADAQAELDRNQAMAGTLGGGGTPLWVVGNRVLSGAQTLEGLQEAVRAARDHG